MKKYLSLIGIFTLCLALSPAQAQPRGGSPGPNFNAALTKLFGKNSAFSSGVEMQVATGGDTITMPGKIFFSEGKSRFEMNMSGMKSSKLPAGAVEQMKAMGMDNMVSISRPDRHLIYLVYPGMQAYAETPSHDKNPSESPDKLKIETTEQGKETVDGHACVKNKVVVTEEDGTQHESTTWNATDLKDFPIKIETTEQGNIITMAFKDVKLAKPDAGLFETPTAYTRYPNVMALMQTEMMKRMGNAAGAPPAKQ